MIIFLVLLSIFLYPYEYKQSPGSGKCVAGSPPNDNRVLHLPAIKNIDDTPRLGQPSDLSIGGPDPSQMADYVQIRSNVPISDHGNTPGWTILGGDTIVGNAHTVNQGEIPEKPGYDLHYPAEWGEMDLTGKSKPRFYIRGEGLLLFVKKNYAPIMEGLPVYFVDVYQDTRKVDYPGKEYTTDELFGCKPSPNMGGNKVMIPAQNPSQDNQQLQLEWFVFQTGGAWILHCKPAVYLYPQEKKLVNVKVFPKGNLIYTDPPYDKQKGWTVMADQNGFLTSLQNRSIPANYLYYESQIEDKELKKPTKGWVVKYEELEDFYNRVLPQLGLNNKEKADFENYWLQKLPKANYYFLGLMDKSQRDYLETLSVTPQPDTSIRFSFYYEPLEQPIAVEEPTLVTPAREGFTLVDWGGMIKLHPGTPFTCSQ